MKNEYDYLNDVKMDFSCYEEEKFEKEYDIMRQNKSSAAKRRKIFVIAACVTALMITTVCAAGFVGNIIKRVTTGYNTFVQINPDASQPLMDELKGMIFDENGAPLESIAVSDIDNMYDKDGNKITKEKYAEMIAEATGGLVEISDNYNAQESEKDFATLEEAQENAVFDIKTPEYLPEDYSLSRIYTYKSDDGSSSGEYINLVYKNSEGKDITIFERILNENTAFEAGTDGSLEEIIINGRTAVIMDDSNLDFETEDNVSVGISSHANISKDELIKIAESVK